MGEHEKDLYESDENLDLEAGSSEFTERFTQALLELVQARLGDDLKPAMQEAGFSLKYIYKIKTGARTMSLDLAGKLLEVAGVSIEELGHLLQQEGRKSALEAALTRPPAALLAGLREPGDEVDSLFLNKLATYLEQIAERKLIVFRRPPAWRAILLVLEEERLGDWRKTRQRLERFSLGWARKLAGRTEVSRSEMADLSTLLAAWAAVQRVAGLRSLAIDAIEIAFGLAERCEDIWSQGFCLQKAAYLARDLGRENLALALINRAALCYSEAGTADDLARVLIDRGYFSYHCGHTEEAQRMLENGLRKVDPNQRLYVVAAHLALARIYREKGDCGRARGELNAAIECQRPGSVEAAYVCWEAAKQEFELDDPAAAEKLLQDSQRVFLRQGRGADLAFVALDYAELLLRTGRLAEIPRLIADVVGWLAPMARSSRALVRPFENLAALLSLGNLDVAELESARQQCRRILTRRAV